MNEIVEKAVNCLGKGFDVTNDFRLKFCKGNKRLVLIDESERREIVVPGFGPLKDVSIDIKCDKGDRIRYQSDVLEFNQMSALFNHKSSLPGKIPTGLFNVMFGFNSGTWAQDASDTKCLALDGYFISFFNLQINRYPLVLSNHVRNAVPASWQPHALARFIETYGTHIIVGVTVGGQDVVFLRQDKSSNLQPSELKKHLDKLGDEIFTGSCTLSPLHWKTKGQKNKIPEAFNVFDPQHGLVDSFRSVSSKDGITIICSKRGGNATVDSHCEWLLTVPSMPDVINFNFVPITSLLKDVPGNGFLSHAINLYLRYKPPIAELQYFLDFQAHKIWAPVHSDLPLGPPTNKAMATPSLQFNFLGPKLYVSTAQVVVGRSPVTGMRLYLEGKKCDRLAIHLQHLSNIPQVLQNQVDDTSIWRGSDELANERYYEPVQWKKFSHVCIAPVKYDPTWAHSLDTAFVVSGAQLHVTNHESKNVLHLRLLFTKVSNSVVCRSIWEQGPLGFSSKLGFSSTGSSLFKRDDEKQNPIVIVDSGVYPTGPPAPVQAQKLLKFVDTSHVCKGPQDSPGHWLVSGAKLDVENGKISLHVKFSLLSFSS
ncbi:MACPF domain-containing protein At1g14780-like [Magnolia sinica]|uniref:MACPF domain-containing protein At1g14780-like n=1 Tax=Magnolia sinica TaxID=86752 RepID=UPI0026593D65|nr:MACPF domain-containing protein At1g14780-like [Magnolia sinica]